ncbi:MAG: DUF4245 domain-containing protein [Actinomycetota bacterium]|nr:DUF4245 domain-containing protein [Actinomycetota bacterium]
MSQQPTPQAPPARRKPFAEQSFADLLRSIGLLLLFVGVVWAVNTVVSPDDSATPVRAVDYRGQLASARRMADYPVLAPRGLGPEWVATSVDLQSSGRAVRWHLGFLTPGREYVGLEQGDLEPQRLVARYVGGLQPAGALTVGGEPWRLYRGETDTALLRRAGGVVTIVVGTAATDVLAEFARSLT